MRGLNTTVGKGRWPPWEKTEKVDRAPRAMRLCPGDSRGDTEAKEALMPQGGEGGLCSPLQEEPHPKAQATSESLCLAAKEFTPTLGSSSFPATGMMSAGPKFRTVVEFSNQQKYVMLIRNDLGQLSQPAGLTEDRGGLQNSPVSVITVGSPLVTICPLDCSQ